MKKQFVAIAIVGAGLLAGCSSSVDREGTRDLMEKQIKDAGLDLDTSCADAVFDQFSDDELNDMNDAADDSVPSAEIAAKFADFQTKMMECVSVPTLGS